MRIVVRLILSAIAFTAILPMINGIDFHGNFLAALLLSIIFGIMLWAVEAIAVALAAVWTVGTFGIALLWIIPFWVLGFWVFPAFALKLTADIMPQYLTVSGFFPAVIAGLVMLGVGVLTSNIIWTKKQSPA